MVRWASTVVGQDDRAVDVSFVGAVEFDRADPCYVEYRPEVSYTSVSVGIVVREWTTVARANGEVMCTQAGKERTLRVVLDEPLRGRELSQ